jgi:hypothetical protein
MRRVGFAALMWMACTPARAPDADTEVEDRSASAVAAKLRKDPAFLIGTGNDLSPDFDHDKAGAYRLPVEVDIHYAYLVGLNGEGGWPEWNPDGTFVDDFIEAAVARDVVPMFTLYAMAAWGEDRMDVLTDHLYMDRWWYGYRLLLKRIRLSRTPVIVHVEPDFWGFAHKASSGDATALPALVGDIVPECEDLPSDVSGLGQCVIRLGHLRAPRAVIGLAASQWAGPPDEHAAFLLSVGADSGDLLVVETLDRDAGCFESGTDPWCTRLDGPWYWDPLDVARPNFADHLAHVSVYSATLERPLLWWQMPLGLPSELPGNPGSYRDNRVRYLFDHPDRFVAAGGLGAVFGPGSPNQTTLETDGGQFAQALAAYRRAPEPF